MSWQEACARCGWILTFSASKWKWKWLKFSGVLLPPVPQSLGGFAPLTPVGPPRLQKHHVMLHKTRHGKVERDWAKRAGQVRSSTLQFISKWDTFWPEEDVEDGTEGWHSAFMAPAFDISAFILNYPLQSLTEERTVMVDVLRGEQAIRLLPDPLLQNVEVWCTGGAAHGPLQGVPWGKIKRVEVRGVRRLVLLAR